MRGPSTFATPSQTAGPFLSIGLDWCDEASLVDPASEGAVVIHGRLIDGAGEPVTDAALEFWQADANGSFATGTEPGWQGFTRCLTDDTGAWALRTTKPGPVPSGEGAIQAPHIDVSIFARGLQQRLVTRIYFGDDMEALAADSVLSSLAAERRGTLVARPSEGGGYEMDIHLQGDNETVFFYP